MLFVLAVVQCSRRDTTAWQAGTTGYLGVRFRDEAADIVVYGWLPLSTTAPLGFPATLDDGCYEDTGASIVTPDAAPSDEVLMDGVDDGLLAAQFAGPMAALRTIYDQLIKVVTTLGPDVEIAPKKSNVSLRRRKQFALLQPSTASRLDVGLILKGVAPDGRLEASGSFNAMFTHRVRIAWAGDIDAQLKRWLREVYDAAWFP